MSDDVMRRMGPRCEWCERPLQDGEDHHERADCVRALREAKASAEQVARDARERLEATWRHRLDWMFTTEGAALLQRFGWTPPEGWVTRPSASPPLAGSALTADEVRALEQRLIAAEQLSPADAYRLIRQARDFLETLKGWNTQQVTNDIIGAAWECLYLDDPSARASAADRLAAALAKHYGHNRPNTLPPRC